MIGSPSLPHNTSPPRCPMTEGSRRLDLICIWPTAASEKRNNSYYAPRPSDASYLVPGILER